MTLLSEQVRNAASEANLINNPTEYSVNGTSMALLKDYGNITLAHDSIVFFKHNLRTSNVTFTASSRVKIGSLYAEGASTNATGVTTYGALVWLAAGTYDVRIEACVGSGGTVFVSSFQLGFVQFSDEAGSPLAAYSSGIALTVPNRVTAVGALSQAVYAINATAYTASAATNFENVGDNLTNGVSVLVDSVQANWDERSQDTGSYQNAHAKCFLPYSVGASHTVTISKRNANTVVHISVVACPWILGIVPFSPVTLNYSQGSTLYVMLEPLFFDVSKSIGAGYPRGISFGSVTDYYNTLSGTGIQPWSYVFDVVKINVNFDVWSQALGGCISNIGVDAR